MRLLLAAIDILLRIIEILIIIRIILSWLPMQRTGPIMNILYQLTEPILGPIRNLISRSSIGNNMMLDISPIIAFLLISVIRNIIFRLLI
ncbi:MAG: YggT family protein [Clostridia bacterium]|jgi:YggT family protein|nr:YggT family protein [Clostridiaceae bacterium]